ncbi:MAG: flavin reductase family protein [Reyranella sp.]|uniref:flavin reductase family protein n=1 Tax=Reyranella sp. TaxID=1929291 RepID=UPI0011F48A10|nr:flavin reductase family protein [Reyranella sp.]TAJ96914.1 MAG: flavin reductase family protein [Reyranella sp.]
MFYECARNDHGLPHNPLKQCVVPRPIGWVSTVDGRGRVNLAPFSFFNLVSESPPLVIYCPVGAHSEGGEKDSLRAVRDVGEFVVNVATWGLREALNVSSAPAGRDVDEFELAGLTKEPSQLVRPPRVKESPLHLECRLVQVISMPGSFGGVANCMVLGEVLGVHIRDDLLQDGLLKIDRLEPIARLGYQEYAVVRETFTMPRPTRVAV